ncbi:MAG: dTMP kinase [Rhizobacter sp.]|nr:dTMP kinase [Rhizobacter sp.]
MNGRFITFEGIDGAGKSTHIEPLAARLRACGRTVVCTREPGGTPLGEQVRALLLHEEMDGVVESMLVFAARRDHLDRVILPALARGDTVLCDRFTDATFAYQGAGRGQDERMLRDLERWVHGDLQPDLTLWFDVDPAIAAARRARARVSDRFESEDAAFFARVRAGYAARMRSAPERFCRIDSSLDKAAVERQIDEAVGALDERHR